MYREPEARRRQFGGALFFVAALALLVYLGFAALYGESGLMRLLQIEGRAVRLEQELATLRAERSEIEAKTTQLWQVSPATGGWSSTIPHGSGVFAPSLASDGSTLTAYRSGGQFGLNCPATGGCTNSQAYPVSSELARLLDSRTDPNQPFNTADPIQIGNSTLLSFSTDGSSTGGTLFIRGEQKHQFAVRVLGTTGRTRVLEFEFANQSWRTR